MNQNSIKKENDENYILGFDPGTQVTGWGLITVSKPTRLVDSGVIRTKRGESVGYRLNEIYSAALKLIHEFKPKVVSIEDPFVGNNPSSALILGQARGVLILSAVRSGIEVASYAPRVIKSSVVGNGNASKEQVQFMVQKLLNLKEAPKSLDESDAIAVAICHITRSRIPTISNSSKDFRTLAKNPDDADLVAQWKSGKRGKR
jgi:crossover junction endodeoxyribonuclease RuvC